MAATTTKSACLEGVLAGLPFVLVIVPFALLFGVVGTEAGLDIAQTMGFTTLVIAGAAQFTAVQLLVEEAPTLVILATALAVNLRMAMYSASLVPHLGARPFWQRAILAYLLVDQTYTASIVRYETGGPLTSAQRLAYFLGVALPIVPLWYIFTWIGAVIGTTIPDSFALDFALPITFIAMMGPLLRTPAHIAAALMSIALSLALAWMPPGTGLLIAGAAAMATGAAVETWTARA